MNTYEQLLAEYALVSLSLSATIERIHIYFGASKVECIEEVFYATNEGQSTRAKYR